MANNTGGKPSIWSKLRFSNWPKGVRVTLCAFLIVVIVALLFPSPQITEVSAETGAITLQAGQTTEVVFTYVDPKAKTDKLVWGSEQPDVAVITMDRFTQGRVICTVEALAPGEATVHLGTGLDLKATVQVTVTE